MVDVNPKGTDWTADEVDLIVAEYFKMLRAELANRSMVKLRVNEKIQHATGRSKGSVEFKNRNISAALQKLGMPIVTGYLQRLITKMRFLMELNGT